MIRLLPFILIPVLIIAGLGYWRYSAGQKSSISPQITENQAPVEVPKTLPGASIEDREVNNLKPSGSPATASNIESRLTSAESAVTDLKARVQVLETATPAPAQAPASVSQPTIYIPMGSASGPWTNSDWSLLNEYEISLDPSNYSGYTGMNLEINYRMVDPTGTGSVRLYNVTDSSVLSSQLDTASTSFKLYTTNTFKLANGQKTYKLQIKSSGGKDLYIQTARIKVSF